MNISYNWLKDLVEIYLPPDELALALTRVGLAVEGIHPHRDDFVLDIDLTSNRPDCLSHLGVAREVSVISGIGVMSGGENKSGKVGEMPLPPVLAGEFVVIENPDLCRRFTARIIRNVKIGPSPEWLVDRLEAVGERSINNVADITNYVMLELGQPMHAFDLDKLAGNRIVVRTARTGETIKTLDEADRILDESMLMICDSEGPIAVGGIMGGLESGITRSTSNVLLEVAYFDRASIRATSRRLGLATEASYRFERGVDINNLKRASDRATQMIAELAGGEPGDFIDVYPSRYFPRSVGSRDIALAVKRLTGLDVGGSECLRILNALGISGPEDTETQNTDATVFTVPSWRHDIAIEEDLVEEVARHIGYEEIKDELPPAYGAGEYQSSEGRKRRLRSTLSANGFDEAIGYSFIDAKHDGVFATVPGLVNENMTEPFVTLQDAVIEGAIRMRATLLPGMLDAIRLNLNHRRRDIKLFEIGKVFAAIGERELPAEREFLAIAIIGGELNEDRAVPTRQSDLYDIKGAVEASLEAIGVPCVQTEADEIKHLRKGQSASVVVSGVKIGSFGRLNQEIAANYKFRQPVYVAEIDLQRVLEQPIEPVRYRPLPRFPSIVRDVSFAVTRDTTYDAVRSAIIDRKIEYCRSVSFVDIFEGGEFEENQRSLTIRLEYQSEKRTLTEDEIEPVHNEIVSFVEQKLKIHQRN